MIEEYYFPLALSWGIDEDKFWKLTPKKLKPYAEADRLRKKENNFNMWLQGLYIHDAFAVVMANAFKEKGKKAETYHTEPIDGVVPLSDKEFALKQKQEQEALLKYLDAISKMWE